MKIVHMLAAAAATFGAALFAQPASAACSAYDHACHHATGQHHHGHAGHGVYTGYAHHRHHGWHTLRYAHRRAVVEEVYFEPETPRYFVNQGPYYDGPGLLAPAPTYRDAAVSGWYPYVSRGYTYRAYGGPYANPMNHRSAYGIRPARRAAASRIIHADAEIRMLGNDRFEMRVTRKRRHKPN